MLSIYSFILNFQVSMIACDVGMDRPGLACDVAMDRPGLACDVAMDRPGLNESNTGAQCYTDIDMLP